LVTKARGASGGGGARGAGRLVVGGRGALGGEAPGRLVIVGGGATEGGGG
jgi:hypothetical protein